MIELLVKALLEQRHTAREWAARLGSVASRSNIGGYSIDPADAAWNAMYLVGQPDTGAVLSLSMKPASPSHELLVELRRHFGDYTAVARPRYWLACFKHDRPGYSRIAMILASLDGAPDKESSRVFEVSVRLDPK